MRTWTKGGLTRFDEEEEDDGDDCSYRYTQQDVTKTHNAEPAIGLRIH